MAKTKPSKLPYKTEWDLTLFYKSAKDPQIGKDIESTRKKIFTFSKKYKGKNFLKDNKTLFKTLSDFEEMSKEIGLTKVAFYYSYRKEINSTDTEAEAALARISTLSAELANEMAFFELELGKIPKKRQRDILLDKKFSHFRYFLENIFENAKFHLTEPEEKILNLKSLPAHGLWKSGFGRVLGKQVVSFKGKEMPLAEVSSSYFNLKKNNRHALYKKMMQTLESVSDFAESEMNAIVTNKKINDELRGYKTPYEETVRGYENRVETVETLRKLVKKFYKTSHKFYSVKAKLLGEKYLTNADRNAPVGKLNKKIPFAEAVATVREEFAKADTKFAELLDHMLKNGQVDVYPKKGKRGGAFCSSEYGLPTFIMLNHTDDENSLSTLAHEMGHAIHSEYSKKQGVLYEDYTISTAEVASTFFEALVFDATYQKATEKEKVVLLHNKLHDDMSTIFRQIACFEFEVDLHGTIREQGYLDKKQIVKLMNKHMSAYLGPIVHMEELDGYMFVSWPHIRRFFYVYSYAFGQIISAALYAKYKEDPKFIDKVIEFLSAGGSMSPEDIFKSIGIDVTKPDFFETGLKQIDSQVKELEKLVKKQ